MNLPSLDSLICFEAAARQLNFREAAKIVCLTPAAVSQRIKQLEEQLGVMLFRRTSRSVRLTDAGLSLLPAARACIAAAESCVGSVQSKEGPPPQEVTIGATYEIGLSWVTPSLGALAEVLPRVTAHLHLGPAPDLLAQIKAKEIDAAITSYSLLDPSYASIDLLEESYAFVASRELLAVAPFTCEEEAQQHTLLDIRPSLPMFRHLAEAPELKKRLEFRRTQFLGSTEAVRQLVRAGRGVAVLPTYLIRTDLEKERLAILLPEVRLLSSCFRLVFSGDDTRRSLYEEMARVLIKVPIAPAER
jgi:LysR family transcriptional regulator, glycine cleavage system transcriptional activator